MNEVEETLTKIEQNYRLFQQQQFSFIRALERTREEGHDMMRPVSSIVQVQIIQHKVLHARESRDSTGLACTWGQFKGEEMFLLKGRWTKPLQESLCITEDVGRKAPIESLVISGGISWLSRTFWFSLTLLRHSQKHRIQENNQTKNLLPQPHMGTLILKSIALTG